MTASSTKLKEPNVLLAATNCRKMVQNVRHVLNTEGVLALEAEIERNVIALFRLGESHLQFARSVQAVYWRQKISRFYYGAYNIRRSVALYYDGHFATDSTDHKTVGELPRDFPKANTFASQLQALRDDRNLADYSHLAEESDLISSLTDVESLVVDFQNTAHSYLTGRGLTL